MKSSFLVLLVLILSFCLVLPCSARYSLQDVTITPMKGTYPSGVFVNTSADLAIIPAGPTTFIEGYTLVLSTDLEKALWNVSIMVDGRQAAVFQKSGATVYINGYLLSYPTTRDVAVRVILEGIVPTPGSGQTFSVLRVIELNNQGQVVPESEQKVPGTIELPVTPPSLPTRTESIAEPPITATPTGISPVPFLGGMFLIFFLIRKRNG